MDCHEENHPQVEQSLQQGIIVNVRIGCTALKIDKNNP